MIYERFCRTCFYWIPAHGAAIGWCTKHHWTKGQYQFCEEWSDND